MHFALCILHFAFSVIRHPPSVIGPRHGRNRRILRRIAGQKCSWGARMAAGESNPHNIHPRHSAATTRASRELRRAERLAESGRVAEAIKSLDSAIRLGADPYTCYLRQARLYQGRQQWSEAVSAAE